MKTTREIVESIDTRLRELREEINTLSAARTALGRRNDHAPKQATAERTNREAFTSDSTRTRTSAKRNGRNSVPAVSQPARRSRTAAGKTSRAKAKRASGDVPADRLESLLSGNGGLTTSELAMRADANRDRVLTMLRELETAGRVRRTGQRRGTRWHVITDEDRIRERAAELEATRKRPT